MKIRRPQRRRSGLVATEAALLMTVLCNLFAMTTDYARIFYVTATLTDTARAGAMYYALHATDPAASIRQAALADATDLVPSPTIELASGVDNSGNSYVQVTASYTFTALGVNPSIPASVVLSQQVRMMRNPE